MDCAFNWIIITDVVVNIKKLSGSTPSSDRHKVIIYIFTVYITAILTVKYQFMFYCLVNNLIAI